MWSVLSIKTPCQACTIFNIQYQYQYDLIIILNIDKSTGPPDGVTLLVRLEGIISLKHPLCVLKWISPGMTANLVVLGIHALNDSGIAGFNIISMHICTFTINNKPRAILTSFTRHTFQ